MSANGILKYLSIFKSVIYNPLLDFIFPPQCFGCDREIDSGLVCNKCYTQLTTTALGVCSICGAPKSLDKECRHPLHQAGIKSYTLTRIRALGYYRLPYINLIHNLKYQNKKKLAQILGLGLANLINADPILSRADYITPIPLHSARLRERGYNQAMLLAKESAFGSGVKFVDCLIRMKNTHSQTNLDYKKRIENIEGAFKLKTKLDCNLVNQKVILVDDVMTSGATLAAAAKILLDNKVQEVYAAVVSVAYA